MVISHRWKEVQHHVRFSYSRLIPALSLVHHVFCNLYILLVTFLIYFFVLCVITANLHRLHSSLPSVIASRNSTSFERILPSHHKTQPRKWGSAWENPCGRYWVTTKCVAIVIPGTSHNDIQSSAAEKYIVSDIFSIIRCCLVSVFQNITPSSSRILTTRKLKA